MNIVFCTDFHLGVTRGSSSHKLQDAIYDKGFSIVDDAYSAGKMVVHLGDLFHKHSNKEAIIQQGATIASRCTYVLAGNHDCLNIDGSVGSLKLIGDMLDCVVINPDMTQPYFRKEEIILSHLYLYMVPHALTQELFEQSLREVCADAAVSKGEYILCLHCNVGEAFGKVEAEGSTLALTDELQDLVAQHFKLVMVGHDHHPRTIKKGACTIIVLGNLLPVAFGEIEDRFVYEYFSETGQMQKTKIFDADTSAAEIEVADLVATGGDWDLEGRMFLDVVGTVKPEEYPTVVRAMQKICKKNEDSLLMSRNAVQIERLSDVRATKPGFVPKTIREMVADAVRGTEYEAEYLALTEGAQS